MSEMVYQHQRYRSRLEVRWTIVLQALQIPHVYEPGTFALPHGLYIPDFWLPDAQRYLEVKPGAPKPDEIVKAQDLAAHYHQSVFFLCGMPEVDRGGLYNADVYWHDGQPLGPGMPVTVKVLYALGLDEAQDAAQRLHVAVHHSHTVLRHLESVWPTARVLEGMDLWWPLLMPAYIDAEDVAALRAGMNAALMDRGARLMTPEKIQERTDKEPPDE